MIKFLRKLFHDVTGVTATEYALIILFIIVTIIAFVGQIGSNISKPFSQAGSSINGTVSH
jgi:Flp pilus assembly pilin Flp